MEGPEKECMKEGHMLRVVFGKWEKVYVVQEGRKVGTYILRHTGKVNVLLVGYLDPVCRDGLPSEAI